MDAQIDAQMDPKIDAQMEVQMDAQMDAQMEAQMDPQMDAQMDPQMTTSLLKLVQCYECGVEKCGKSGRQLICDSLCSIIVHCRLRSCVAMDSN